MNNGCICCTVRHAASTGRHCTFSILVVQYTHRSDPVVSLMPTHACGVFTSPRRDVPLCRMQVRGDLVRILNKLLLRKETLVGATARVPEPGARDKAPLAAISL